jgi:hypothetical protein
MQKENVNTCFHKMTCGDLASSTVTADEVPYYYSLENAVTDFIPTEGYGEK